MLRWAATFYIIALIAGLFGFTGATDGDMKDGLKLLFFIMISLFIITLFVGYFLRKP